MRFFKKMTDYHPLLEDVNKAKKYMSGKSQEDQKTLKLMMDLCQKKNCMGYVYMFVYFMVEFNFMFADAEALADRLDFFKRNNLIQKLPKNPVDYVLDGPEKLEDAMNQVERNNKAQRIYLELPINLRKIIDVQTEENKNKFKEAAILFYELPDKTDLIKKISAFKTYPDLMSALISFVKKRDGGADYDTLLNNLKSNTGVVVVYENSSKGVIVARIDSFDASKQFGSDAWCISRDKSYFDQYVRDLKTAQYFSWWFEKEITDNLFIIGFTVKQDGKMNFAHKKDDKELVGVNKKRYLEQTGIPTDVIKTLTREQALKRIKGMTFEKMETLIQVLFSANDDSIILEYISDLEPNKQLEILSLCNKVIFKDKMVEIFLNKTDQIDVEKYMSSVAPYFLRSKELLDQFIQIIKKYVKNERSILSVIKSYETKYYYTENRDNKHKYILQIIDQTIKDPQNKSLAYFQLNDPKGAYEVWKETGVVYYDKWAQLGSWMVKNGKKDDVKKLLATERYPKDYRAYRLHFYIQNHMNEDFLEEYNMADWKSDGMRNMDSRSEMDFNKSLFDQALYVDNLELVKFFVEKKGVKIARDFSSNYELVSCCVNGFYNVFKYLIETLQMDPNNGDAHWIKDRNLEDKKKENNFGEYLIACIPNWFEYSKEKTKGQTKILKYLVEEKHVDIFFRNCEPLKKSIERENFTITQYFIDKGCRISKKLITDKDRLNKADAWIKKGKLNYEDVYSE